MTKSETAASPASIPPWKLVLNSLAVMGALQLLYRAAIDAYNIRLYAIEEYGRVIHEFDPYFNYRATEYLWANGWKAFATWFDYKVWYPLGRPVGTTIYPGMQVTTCAIKKFLLPNWSINDICCFVPAWFGVTATLSLAWLTYECVAGNDFGSILADIPLVRDIYRVLLLPIIRAVLGLLVRWTGSDWGLTPRPVSPLTPLASAAVAAAIMAIVPAHLMRSVGGGYDNESVAMTAMVLTFACWARSLRSSAPLWVTCLWGGVTGLAYFNMVAAWGGYIFVINLIGVHAGVLVLLGRFSSKLHRAYSCFYVVGTALAIQVPVVGWTPLKSLEQMGPLIGFFGLQLLEVTAVYSRRQKNMTRLQVWKLRITVFLGGAALAALIVFALAPKGYFGPISSRVRGLFVKHTKTGNPLVDSVAEHQAASPQAYYHYLNNLMYVAPVGFFMTAAFFVSDSSSFLLVYGMAAYYFSHRMVRLLLLTSPIASCFGGIVIGRVAVWMFSSLAGEPLGLVSLVKAMTDDTAAEAAAPPQNGADKPKGKGKKTTEGKKEEVKDPPPVVTKSDPLVVKGIRLLLSACLLYWFLPYATKFNEFAHQMAHQISNPSIIQKGRTKDGRDVLINDYREAYMWLGTNTEEDARIMAWWDYGYQITGISNRTTIADGNTWNHEHIAFLGRILTSPETDAHRMARHLADYVLVWSGGGGDDLAKSPHLRRIANSVFRGLCDEPTCGDFGFYQGGVPTEAMEESLLYKLTMNQVKPEVQINPNRFREVYRSKYGKVRIYKILSVSQESKDWVANPANRKCDAPGSWFCRGQYPPALEKMLKEKRDFRQLEDFNVKDGEDDSEYTRQYLENLQKPKGPRMEAPQRKAENKKPQTLTPEDIDLINDHWENNHKTTLLWELISQNKLDDLKLLFDQAPEAAHIRSEDGRGPMWWAYEYGRQEVVDLLKSRGVRDDLTDAGGMKARELAKSS